MCGEFPQRWLLDRRPGLEDVFNSKILPPTALTLLMRPCRRRQGLAISNVWRITIPTANYMQLLKTAICVGPAAMTLADATVTLSGQPADYWLNGFQTVLEINPIASFFLKLHPAVFVAFVIIWIVVFNTLLLVLPTNWSKIMALMILLGHTFGMATWIVHRPHGLLLVIGVAAAARVLAIPLLDLDRTVETSARRSRQKRQLALAK